MFVRDTVKKFDRSVLTAANTCLLSRIYLISPYVSCNVEYQNHLEVSARTLVKYYESIHSYHNT